MRDVLYGIRLRCLHFTVENKNGKKEKGGGNKEAPENRLQTAINRQLFLLRLRFQKKSRMHRLHVRDQGQRFGKFFAAKTAVHSVSLYSAIVLLVSSKAI